MKIKNVVVIGASGTVGKAVSGIFASFGNAKVYMIAHNKEKLEKSYNDAALSVKAITVKDNLIPLSMDDISKALKKADFVFESVVENFEIKSQIHKIINENVSRKCIISTGTSGLSINKLSDCYDEEKKKNFLGVHFFNPPYNMLLCEIIPSNYTSKKLVTDLNKYLTEVLLRETVIVKDEPAFLANRIGFEFMNEAIQYAYKYRNKGGIDYIDTILGRFTGRNMAPIQTADFVGLDVHKAIVDNVKNNIKTSDRKFFDLPNFVNKLIEDGKLGVKTKEGLYKNEDGNKLVYDINANNYREINKYDLKFINQMVDCFKVADYIKGFEILKNDNSIEAKICMKLLLKYIIYSIEISKELCGDNISCDVAMASGFNWIPPLALVEVLGGNKEVINLCDKYLNEKYEDLLINLPKSKYDYRKYIKARV